MSPRDLKLSKSEMELIVLQNLVLAKILHPLPCCSKMVASFELMHKPEAEVSPDISLILMYSHADVS